MKRLICLLLCTALMLCAAGCGKTEPETEHTLEPTDPPKTVELCVWVDESLIDLTQQMADEFAKQYPDVIFQIQVSAQGENGCADAIFAAPESAPDVFVFTDDQLPSMVQAGFLADLSEYSAAIEDNASGSSRLALYDGKYYAFPMSISSCAVLYYDESFFISEDVRSLDQMVQKARESDKAVGMQFGANGGWFLNAFFAGAGLNVSLSDDGMTNICDWDSPLGVSVCSAVLDLVSSGGFVADITGGLVSRAMTGQMPAFIAMPSDSKSAQQAYGSHCACAILPQFTVDGAETQMSSFAVCSLVGVSANTDEPEYAAMLADWLTDEANQTLRYQQSGRCPTNPDSAEAIGAGEQVYAAMARMSQFAVPQWVGSNYWPNAAQLGQVLAAGWTDELDLEAVLQIRVVGITAPVE